MAAEDRVQRTWERTVKYYENLRVVFEIQTQLKEWTDEQPTIRTRRSSGEEMSTDAKVVGYCRACGKALDESNVRTAHGTIYCEEHVPMTTSAEAAASAVPPSTAASAAPRRLIADSPYTRTPPPRHSESRCLAGTGLRARPDSRRGRDLQRPVRQGTGARHHHRTVDHVLDNDSARGLEPLVGLMLAGFWCYMAFEAYHTAQRRQRGLVVDEFSSLIPMPAARRFPVAPVMLIALGVMFLLNNLDLLDFCARCATGRCC